MSQRKILVLVGPQGTGNHCWSKIFSRHADVCGWNELEEQYWVSHKHEPFYKYWKNPELLYDTTWEHEYYFTNMSYPRGGQRNRKLIGRFDPSETPDFPSQSKIDSAEVVRFIEVLEDIGFDVQVAVTSRDKNIIDLHQRRRWPENTTQDFLDILPELKEPIFLSYESLILYREHYVRSLKVNIPVDYSSVSEAIKFDANEKYIVNSSGEIPYVMIDRKGRTVGITTTVKDSYSKIEDGLLYIL